MGIQKEPSVVGGRAREEWGVGWSFEEEVVTVSNGPRAR